MNNFSARSNPFDASKKIDKNGSEYWSARELMSILGYSRWQTFHPVIQRAILACKKGNHNVNDQFTQVGNLIEVAKGAKYPTIDFNLTRYACYLIAQNGDPKKNPIALAQSYFAVQTRKQEAFDQLPEEEKRLIKRENVKNHNIALNNAAAESGVENFGYFHSKGYQGMYNEKTKNEIQKYKKIGSDNPLDRAGYVELAANDFRITQTEQKLKSELNKGKKIGQAKAGKTHYDIGKITRKAMEQAGNLMPEDLKPEIHIEELEKQKGLEKEKRNRPQLL